MLLFGSFNLPGKAKYQILLITGSLRYVLSPPFPVKIKWYSHQHNQCSYQRFFGFYPCGVDGPGAAQDYIDRGKPWIAGAAIRPLRIGLLAPQHKQSGNGKDVAEDHHEHYIGKELVILAAQGQHRGPYRLQDKAGDR